MNAYCLGGGGGYSGKCYAGAVFHPGIRINLYLFLSIMNPDTDQDQDRDPQGSILGEREKYIAVLFSKNLI
jgi:hypothetical protein